MLIEILDQTFIPSTSSLSLPSVTCTGITIVTWMKYSTAV